MKVNKKFLFGSKELNQMKLSKMIPKGITVHNSLNSATAHNEAANVFNNNTKKGSKGAAVHYFIDEDSIYQCVPDNFHGWHSGDGGRGFGNRNTISIEICRSLDYKSNNYARAEVNAAKFIILLMEKYNIPLNQVKRHYDYSKKRCPHRMFESNPRNWEQFKSLLSDVIVDKPTMPALKPLNQIAAEVIRGRWKNMPERKRLLEAAGYDYEKVRREVNRLLR